MEPKITRHDETGDVAMTLIEVKVGSGDTFKSEHVPEAGRNF